MKIEPSSGPLQGERHATQVFALRNVLVDRAGQRLTHDVIESIIVEMTREMQNGPCAWAFLPSDPG